MNPTTVPSKIQIHPTFSAFVEDELLPCIGLEAQEFWHKLESLLSACTQTNRELLSQRQTLQKLINDWHLQRQNSAWDAEEYVSFLRAIDYLQETDTEVTISTENVDGEIAELAGPQLVVPLSNARFALNAANARWGSLYDALYGTDVIDSDNGQAAGAQYNKRRGAAVVRRAQTFLNQALPLQKGGHERVIAYRVEPGGDHARLVMVLDDQSETQLQDVDAFVGYIDSAEQSVMLLCHHGLHVELHINADHPVGADSPASVCDVVLESALTTIQDAEDSVAAVDAEDKVAVYRNWLGLMQGTLSSTFQKASHAVTRTLAADREYTAVDGSTLVLPGRSLMLVRNVGHLMTTDAVLDASGQEVFEGILDAFITTACALVDLRDQGLHRNSRRGSVYIVKPKMHGTDEVAFTVRLFAEVERLLGLPANTVKMGVMDEERRTTLNLPGCIEAARERLVFINTGFLDRTGDEIHTSMMAGPVLPKEAIKQQPWIQAYEDWNVDHGIRCGLPGRAQIGKGMWAMPDEMKAMVETKQAHPMAGANCAWVPSPTAATLHAMHYHQIDVFARQQAIAQRPLADIRDILTPPLLKDQVLDAGMVQQELDNNAQGILGYVVRWIDQGIGCSKVPDIHDTGLMEDRATLRISSQHMANWLQHGLCSKQQIHQTFERMAVVVDGQNADDPQYQPMAPDFENNLAFQAAIDLVLLGAEQPNGYTEPLLHAYRRQRKAQG